MGWADAAGQWVSIAAILAAISVGSTGTCPAQAVPADPRRSDLRIEDGRVAGNVKAIQVLQGEVVELRWSADRRNIVHQHGQDIEITVNPGPAVTRFSSTSKCIPDSRA